MAKDISSLSNGDITFNEDATDLKSGTVCIVDDDPANLTLLGSILSNHGFNVLSATDAESAFTLMEEEPPDLILLDIMISPEMDGYEICKRLKTEETTQDIPVIFLSALDQAIDKVKAFQAGGVDYITKPFLTDEVIARVQSHIQQHQVQQQMAIQYETLQKEIARRRQIERELAQTNKQLELLVTIDSLTGLNNRRHFNYHFEQEWKRMIREKKPMALLLCDIDGFEEYNQNFGTHAGDLVLQKIANIIKKLARRPGDTVARWGEDEFIILLPRTDEEGAVTLAEQIQKNTIDLFAGDSSDELPGDVTISIGIASTLPAYGLNKEMLLLDTSGALKQAKNSEKNIVCSENTAT
jgi:two-component system chemotaxis family response regulator WspR